MLLLFFKNLIFLLNYVIIYIMKMKGENDLCPQRKLKVIKLNFQ